MLKSCPMCDSNNIKIMDAAVRGVYFVTCGGCGTRTGDYIFETEAIGTWNMRVREDKIWKQLEKFRASLECESPFDALKD